MGENSPLSSDKLKRYLPLGLFLVLLFVVIVFRFGIISSPTSAGDGHDEIVHLAKHALLMNYIKSDLGVMESPLRHSVRKPHLPYLVSALFSTICPSGYSAVLAANMIFGLLWMIVVYLLAVRLFNPIVALVSACVLAGLPATWWLADHLGNDIQVSFFVVLLLMIAIDSKRMSGFVWWLPFGVIAGLGMLSKPTLPLYVAGPILLILGRSIYLSYRSKSAKAALTTLLGMVCAGLLALLVWLPWFGFEVSYVLDTLKTIVQGPGKDFSYFHNVVGLTIWGMMIHLLGWAGTVGMIVGFVALLYKLKNKPEQLLFAAFIVPFLLLVVVAEAFVRLMFPVLFIPIVFGVMSLYEIPQRTVKYAALLCVAVLFLALFYFQHQSVEPRIFPKHDRNNTVYQADQIVDYMAEHKLNELGGDAVFINMYPFEEKPEFLFHLLSLQDLPELEYIHVYSEGKDILSIVLYDQMINRLSLIHI